MARANGVEDLLPYTVKGTEEKIMRRQEQGLRVKGTGVGQKVKGKLWERTMKGRLEKRKQAMLGMPALVQQWKQVIELFIARPCMIVSLTAFLDGSRTWLEEVAEINGFIAYSSLVACTSGKICIKARGILSIE